MPTGFALLNNPKPRYSGGRAPANLLECCATFAEQPSFFRGKNTAVFVFLDRADQAGILPDDPRVECVSIGSRECRDFAIGCVLLCTACRGLEEWREIDVSTVSSGP